ncbi:MAG: hypothetical protein JWN57_715 [Frankiales bacterium]|nr:hypothetical protein [Frankiales bacterium]
MKRTQAGSTPFPPVRLPAGPLRVDEESDVTRANRPEIDDAVHLRLGGRLHEEDCNRLRQQLAACLTAGVTRLAVDLHDVEEIDLAALQVLAGAAAHLHRTGGCLTVTRPSARALTLLRRHELTDLLVPCDAEDVDVRAEARRWQAAGDLHTTP